MSDNVLSLTDVQKSFGERVILKELTFGLDEGTRIGLIGDNGAGKSTLMRIILGLEPADGGSVVLRGDQRVHFLEQVPELPADSTVREILLATLQPLIDAIAAYQSAISRQDDEADRWLEDIDRLGGWDYEHRLERAAQELSIADLDAVVGPMSGGEKKRVALARMVLSDASLLLLDEPTNHLDAETVTWLEQWLVACGRTLIVVTHDRYFLEEVVERMAELREGVVRVYEGAYTDYLEARALEESHRESVRGKRLNMLRRELEWARRSPKARTSKSKARLGKVDKLKNEERQLKVEQAVSEIRFGAPPRLGKTILELVAVGHGYPEGPPLLDGLSLIVRRGERLGIVGPNGCGKSTLLKLIADELSPSSGKIIRGKNTVIAVFDQHRTELDPMATVRHTLVPDGGDYVFPPGSERVHVATWLARFGFPTRTHSMQVASLSGGERNRLAIAQFLLKEANLLLLDEPTNDLDLMTLDVLERALVEFQGCLLVVSHDRYFLDKISTAIIGFETDQPGSERVVLVQGDYTNYQRLRLDRLLEIRKAQSAERAAQTRQRASTRAVEQESKKKRLTYAEELELEAIEDRIEAADQEVSRLEAAAADPELWLRDREKAAAVGEELGLARERAQQLMDRWQDLMERSEA